MEHSREKYDELLNIIITQFLENNILNISGDPKLFTRGTFNYDHYETGFTLVHLPTLYEIPFFFRFYNIGREKRLEFQTENNHKYYEINSDYTELLFDMLKYWTNEIKNDSKYGAKGTSKFLKNN